MAAQRVGLFMFLWIIDSAGDLPEVKAGPGEDVTQCNTSTDAALTKIEWRRTELKDDYVFFFRDNKANESFQNPRYRGRVS
ncbi:Butyrophilin subfamily 1 member A1 [Dissostichus eleginoides]|uniref:Butyrophilin subfamily 1 member A1 n=1 Tax=Dissostichus eleginoides TaxID=100907 RepID=A0AAD9BTL4_DISEL|nr:Butyrophilin subfamily 1 member A1 [Dissostichus eleginoides]